MDRKSLARRPWLPGALGLGFLNLLLFADVLWPGSQKVLSSGDADLAIHFIWWRQFAFEQLRNGHLTLWNPHYLCGAPFLGGFQAALLYPPNWAYLFTPLVFAVNSGIVLHVFLAGFFTYLWALQRGLSPLACFTAGVVFMFGGAHYLHLSAGHLPNLCAMVWAPLIFLSLDGILEKNSPRWILLGLFALSMQILAGHPQYVYFTAIIAWFYLLFHLGGKPDKARILGSFLAITLGAVCVTAIQSWTGLEALWECGRNSPMEYRSAASFSFPAQNLLTLVLPDLFGGSPNGPYWSQWYPWEVSIFVGSTALFLAVASLGVKDPGPRWRLAGMAVIAMGFALGSATPLHRWMYEAVPGFSGIRGMCKFAFLSSLFLALLAGMGLEDLIGSKKPPKGWACVILLTGSVLLLAALGLRGSVGKGPEGAWAQWFTSLHWLRDPLSTLEPALRNAMVEKSGAQAVSSLWRGSFFCFSLGSILALAKYFRGKMAWGLVALLVLELFGFARAHRPTFEMSPLRAKIDSIRDFYSKTPGDFRVYGTGAASLGTGGEEIWEDEPMILGRYGRFLCASQGIPEDRLFSTSVLLKEFGDIFGMLRLKYRIHLDEDPARIQPMPFKILPRMLLLGDWEVVGRSGDLLPKLLSPGFDPGRKVLLEEDPGLVPHPGKRLGSVVWEDLSTDEIEVTAQTTQPSLLLVTDNYSQGWRVKPLEGSSQAAYKVLPGDYTLRAIPLSAGHHHFRLVYEPMSFRIGKWVSALSCFWVVAILLFLLKKENPR